MQQLRRYTDAKDAAQRFQAQQAGRPAVSNAAQARELAWAIEDALKLGDIDAARTAAQALRPLLGWLDDDA